MTSLLPHPDVALRTPVALSAPVNLRDLGGIVTVGGVIRRGFAIRADDLSTVTDVDADGLVDAGLRAVIDLRSGEEVAATGRGVLGGRSDVTYHHVPLLADIGAGVSAPAATSGDDLFDQTRFGAMYLRMIDSAAEQIVTALAIIAYAPGAVAFHCAAGQDRTGVLAASLLLALGAGPDDIVADYARTGENSAAIHVRLAPLLRPLMERFGIDLDAATRAAGRTAFSPQPMRELLDGLTERHGDPLTPLREAGLTPELIAQLRDRAGVA